MPAAAVAASALLVAATLSACGRSTHAVQPPPTSGVATTSAGRTTASTAGPSSTAGVPSTTVSSVTTQPVARQSKATRMLSWAVAASLNEAVGQADAYGGQTAVATWVDDDPAPALAGDAQRTMRMWSVSKAVVAVAAWTAAGPSGSLALRQATSAALTASDNCAMRRMTLLLQESVHGLDAAQTAIEETLARAGVTMAAPPQRGDVSADPQCRHILAMDSTGLAQPLAPALLMGVAQWTVADAARFAHALGTGAYGPAGDTVRDLMRRPKEHPITFHAGDYTSSLMDPPSSGRFPLAWSAAYKGGWGGHNESPPGFLASEIAILSVHGHTVVVAASFRPSVQPPSDDPGSTKAPLALGTVFSTIEGSIRAALPEARADR